MILSLKLFSKSPARTRDTYQTTTFREVIRQHELVTRYFHLLVRTRCDNSRRKIKVCVHTDHRTIGVT